MDTVRGREIFVINNTGVEIAVLWKINADEAEYRQFFSPEKSDYLRVAHQRVMGETVTISAKTGSTATATTDGAQLWKIRRDIKIMELFTKESVTFVFNSNGTFEWSDGLPPEDFHALPSSPTAKKIPIPVQVRDDSLRIDNNLESELFDWRLEKSGKNARLEVAPVEVQILYACRPSDTPIAMGEFETILIEASANKLSQGHAKACARSMWWSLDVKQADGRATFGDAVEEYVKYKVQQVVQCMQTQYQHESFAKLDTPVPRAVLLAELNSQVGPAEAEILIRDMFKVLHLDNDISVNDLALWFLSESARLTYVRQQHRTALRRKFGHGNI